MSNELALANAIASVEMEGLYLSDDGYDYVAGIPTERSLGTNSLKKPLS